MVPRGTAGANHSTLLDCRLLNIKVQCEFYSLSKEFVPLIQTEQCHHATHQSDYYFAVLVFHCKITVFDIQFSEDVGVGVIWEELLTTSKLLCSTYLKIRGICSLKALKFKRLKCIGENTEVEGDLMPLGWESNTKHTKLYLRVSNV